MALSLKQEMEKTLEAGLADDDAQLLLAEWRDGDSIARRQADHRDARSAS
jgi:hypothetical protein